MKQYRSSGIGDVLLIIAMLMTLLGAISLMMGCKTMKSSTIPLTSISPSESFGTLYEFKSPGVNVSVRAEDGTYQMGDSIELIKHKQK